MDNLHTYHLPVQQMSHQPAVTMNPSSSWPSFTAPSFGARSQESPETADIWVSPFPYSAVRPETETNSALFVPGKEKKLASTVNFMTTNRLYKPTADLDEAQPLLPLRPSEVPDHNYTCVSPVVVCPLKVIVDRYKDAIKAAKQRGNVNLAEQMRDILAKAKEIERNLLSTSKSMQAKWLKMDKKKRERMKMNRKTVGNDSPPERAICTSDAELAEIEQYFTDGFARHGMMHKQSSHLHFIRRLIVHRNFVCSCTVYYEHRKSEQSQAAKEREKKENEKKTKKKPEPVFVEVNEGYRHLQNPLLSGSLLKMAKVQAAECAKSRNMTKMLADLSLARSEHSGYSAAAVRPALKRLPLEAFQYIHQNKIQSRELAPVPNVELSVTTEYMRGRVPKYAEQAAAGFSRFMLADFVKPFHEQAPETYPPTMSDNQIMEKILRASGPICVEWDTEPLERGLKSRLFRPPLGPAGLPLDLMRKVRDDCQAGNAPLSTKELDKRMKRYKEGEECKAWDAVIKRELREKDKENKQANVKAKAKPKEEETTRGIKEEPSDTKPPAPAAPKKATKPTAVVKPSKKSPEKPPKPVEFVIPEGWQKCYGEDGFIFMLPTVLAANFADLNKEHEFTLRNNEDVQDFLWTNYERSIGRHEQSTFGTTDSDTEMSQDRNTMNDGNSSRKRPLDAVSG